MAGNLVLTREPGQATKFFIDDEQIGREVVTIQGGRIRSVYEFNPAIRIVREELCGQGSDGKGEAGRTQA